ncbi:hypothetical protein PSEUBRA_006048 [Kalmanozyma brasiliensis GHG001]|uniref:uncharacterized protein n=1 Tax=Kalmanozyma brasiliensis (strain GHG001) TaxID=1365824 RepID=UPI001CE9A730|nr:uncharacterized protein PSEUBRA_006048 [Kalmanozyma brasiliensis GHG001]KAF6767606.1 hypothetical protein PSEUBRA_006048 [Kalmanozyma brasiliensis GHG001]
MDAVDFDILRALSQDLSADGWPVPGPARGGESSTAPAQPVPVDPFHSEPGKQTADTASKSGRRAARTTGGEYNRFLAGLAEPQFIKELNLLPPLNTNRRAINYKSDDAVRDRIVSHLFANKLHWVEAKTLRLDEKDYYRRSPYQRQTRLLPLVRGSVGSGGEHPIYMTANNPQGKKFRNMEGSPLNGRPYYSFWGVPDAFEAKQLPITYYGSGYLDEADHVAVDQHVRPLLEGLKHAGQVHV